MKKRTKKQAAEELILGLALTPRQAETMLALYALSHRRLTVVSSVELAAALGVTRAAAWDAVRRLVQKGAAVAMQDGWALPVQVRAALRIVRGAA